MIGRVGCEIRDADGRLLTAWQGRNMLLNGGRSAFAAFLLQNNPGLTPNFFWFGTGSAVPAASDSGLQYFVTAKPTGSYLSIGASGFTGRYTCTLGTADVTGQTFNEIMMASGSATTNPGQTWAKALLNGGTGITHSTGTQAVFFWDLVLATGQQPF